VKRRPVIFSEPDQCVYGDYANSLFQTELVILPVIQ
jgi:hypothetical protein